MRWGSVDEMILPPRKVYVIKLFKHFPHWPPAAQTMKSIWLERCGSPKHDCLCNSDTISLNCVSMHYVLSLKCNAECSLSVIQVVLPTIPGFTLERGYGG